MKLKTQKVRIKYYLYTMLCMLMLSSIEVQAQETLITGVISSTEDGLPIPGVSVVLKGSSQGTITDFDGNFSVKASIGQVLELRFIGMRSQDVTIDKMVINVQMENDMMDLDEVIAIGYGVQRKKEITGAVAQVKAEEVTRHVTSDLASALQGQVAGVNVISSSGEPGAESSIQIRGISSLGGDNVPLYVVDGIPQEGDPRISPNEIETIDILKDAASCAVYGTRGAAGVILITTKQGTEGGLKVRLNGTYGIQKITSGVPKMNTTEQLYYDQLYARNAQPEFINDYALRNPSMLINDNNIFGVVQNDNAATQNYSVNLSGGTKNISANAVLGYFDQEGVMINSYFKRYNGRLNAKFSNSKLTVQTNIGFNLEEKNQTNGGLLTQAYKFLPYYPVIDINTDYIGETGGNGVRMQSILRTLQNEQLNTRDRIDGGVNVDYKLIKGLSLVGKMGGSITNIYATSFSPSFQQRQDSDEVIVDPTKSGVSFASSRLSTYSAEVALDYQVTFKKDHSLKTLVNFSAEERAHRYVGGSKEGVIDNNIKVIDGATVNDLIWSGNRDYESTLVGTLVRMQYDYKKRYLLSASVRRDGSSKFAPENRWGLFPSFMAGWNVADENFWKPISKTVNSFKLRASYGVVGNERINNYTYTGLILREADYVYGNNGTDYHALGTAQRSYANVDVKWEESVQINGGLDMGLFKNKLTFNADYYYTQKQDMLFPVKLPSSAGAMRGSDALVSLNVGDMTNEGMEFSLLHRSKVGKVNYRIGGVYTQNTNMITKMSGDNEIIINANSSLITGNAASMVTALMLGHEAGAYYLYETTGVIKTQEQLDAYKQKFANAQMGDMMFNDSNNDGEITEEDRVYSGSALPDFEVGINFGLDWKGIDFSMNWYGSFGGQIMNGSRAMAYSEETHPELMYMWSDVNPQSDIPLFRGKSSVHHNYLGQTDYWLEDGSYIRLRNVTLGYNLPKRTLSKAKISHCRLFVTAQNPLTITNYSGYDPEVGGSISTRGLDKGRYPVSSSYSLGCSIEF